MTDKIICKKDAVGSFKCEAIKTSDTKEQYWPSLNITNNKLWIWLIIGIITIIAIILYLIYTRAYRYFN